MSLGLNYREFERVFCARTNRNGTSMPWVELTPEQIRDCFITYNRSNTDNDREWRDVSYEPKSYYSKWMDFCDALSYVTVRNGSDISAVKDLGEFNIDGADIHDLFESREVAHAK